MLTTTDHDRDRAGLTYVYPVLSRRSGGLSIGVNLNPNNACNWRCVYCQVPELRRGAAPPIDVDLLERELRGFLDEVLHGDFYQRFEVPEAQRVVRDIAISGNGEPTSAAEFDRVVERVGRIARDFGLLGQARLVLITNGSLVRRQAVRRGLGLWGGLGGVVWFKVDSATAEGSLRINGARRTAAALLGDLELAAGLCPTWLQTCLFACDGEPPAEAERAAYLDLLRRAAARGVVLRGVLLYGLARPSRQPEAPRLSALPPASLEAFAAEIRALGLEVSVSV